VVRFVELTGHRLRLVKVPGRRVTSNEQRATS
jgi:hypothetical protein